MTLERLHEYINERYATSTTGTVKRYISHMVRARLNQGDSVADILGRLETWHRVAIAQLLIEEIETVQKDIQEG